MMDRDFYIPEKQYTIFALVLPEKQLAYVQKTSSNRLSAVYSRHICGGCAATRQDFNKTQKPELHLLEVIQCTGAEAYKHVLAWMNLFMEADYCCLNPHKSLDQADEPYMDTAALIKQLKAEPFEEMLKRTYITHPTDADRLIRKFAQSPVTPVKEPTTQINMRIHQRDKLLFEEFCKKLSVNQREGFSLLLDKAVDHSEHLQGLLSEKGEKISKLQKEIQKLQNKLSILSGEKADPTVSRQRRLLSIVRGGINAYLKRLDFDTDSNPLTAITTRQFMKSSLSANAYFYPDKEGYMEMSLDALLWSKSKTRAIFVLGTANDGHRYKFRYYAKKNYIGYGFGNCPYFYTGSKCLVLYMQAADGAMDIIGAFPLPKSEITAQTVKKSEDEPLSIDERIRQARKKI